MTDTPRTDAHYARCKDYARKAAFQNRWEGGADPPPQDLPSDEEFAQTLELELAAVTADLAALHALASDRLLQIAVLREQRADMRDERDAAMSDARRYRYMRSRDCDLNRMMHYADVALDAAIDAAMAGKGEG